MTAGVYRQCEIMKEFLVPVFPRLNLLAPGWNLLEQELTAPDGCKFLWYSADSPRLAEGQHAENLALLLDESKSINGPMAKNMMLRFQPKKVLAMSSAGDAIGWFADAFGRDAGQWDNRAVTAFDCRESVKQWALAEAKRLGGMEAARTDPDFCSAVLSEFSSGTTNALFPLRLLQHALQLRDIIPHHHDRIVVAGLDASKATGEGDECVLRFRLGNKIYRKKTYVGFSSIVDLAGRILEDLIKENAQYLNYDSADLGVGDVLKRMIDSQKGRIKMFPISFGGKANDQEKYHNKRVEMYYAVLEAIRGNDFIMPPDADDLIAQLATIQGKPTENGIKKLISKSDMRKEGIRSPDDADATVLCWQKPKPEAQSPLSTDISEYWGEGDESKDGKRSNYHPSGFHLGRG